MNFLEQQKIRFQVASREIAEMKKNLAELENADKIGASDSVTQLRNEVATLRAKVRSVRAAVPFTISLTPMGSEMS